MAIGAGAPVAAEPIHLAVHKIVETALHGSALYPGTLAVETGDHRRLGNQQ
jgi:hypothetical protein